MIDWLQENPHAPIYYPSKTTIIFKNRNYSYQNTQYNQSNVNSCMYFFNLLVINKHTLIANEKIQKLTELMNLNEEMVKKLAHNSNIVDMDLTDFKFSVNDKVQIE